MRNIEFPFLCVKFRYEEGVSFYGCRMVRFKGDARKGPHAWLDIARRSFFRMVSLPNDSEYMMFHDLIQCELSDGLTEEDEDDKLQHLAEICTAAGFLITKS